MATKVMSVTSFRGGDISTTRDDDCYFTASMDLNDFDPFRTQTSSTPDYFQVERLPEDDLFVELLDKPLLPWNKYHSHCKDMKDSINYQVALILWKMPQHTWNPFRNIDQSAHLKHAIRLAATLIFMLIPKDALYISDNWSKLATQLNGLWEQLSQLWTCRAPVEDACKFIMQLLTIETESYSLVTESKVSELIDCYGDVLQLHTSFPTPYKHLGFGRGLMDQWFKEIMEVVDNIESPPKLRVDDHTRLLMKILSRDADIEYLLSTLNLYLYPYNGEECSQVLLKLAFDSLLYRVIRTVNGQMMCQLSATLRPLFQLYHMAYHSHLSPEIVGLIHVAEVRRIALGSRFISRNHLLWAFYECGHVLPPKIRKTIQLNSADENHPPYHIYLASMKLAKRFSEKMQLENFIFAVIHLKDNGVDEDQMREMESRYKDFLQDLSLGNVRALERFHKSSVHETPAGFE